MKFFSLAVKLTAVACATAAITVISCGGDTVTAPKSCAAGELLCGTACIDSTTDPANCGGCGIACKSIEVCSGSVCSLTCSGKSTQCGQSCVDLNVSPTNCGACGTTCKAGEICSAGKCTAQCPANQKLCLGDGGAVSCITTTTDSANCGDCGIKCDAGKVCNNGTCTDTCGPGVTFCAGSPPYCANTQVDNGNCGACGTACGNGLVCVNGKCGGNCGPNEVLCPAGDAGPAYCAVIQSDNSNCGSCGNVCGAGLLCAAGKCVNQCSQGLTQCGQSCVDLQSDRDNCNGCGIKCSGGTPNCIGGVCGAGIVYSQSFPQGNVSSNSIQCTSWQQFATQLTGVFSGVSLTGSNDSTGYTCSGGGANTICQAIHTGSTVSVPCNGHTWHVGSCGGVELNVDQGICSCGNPGYVIRACINNPNWGGIKSATCNAPAQTITVKCQ